LSFEDGIRFVNRSSSFWDWSIKKIEIFDFFKHSNEIRIEVNFEKVIFISSEDVEF
jgi:hypothetical protein